MAATTSSYNVSFLLLSLVLAMIVSASADYGYTPNVPKPKTDEHKGDGYGYVPDVPKPKKTDEPKTTGYGYVPNVPKPKADKPKIDGYGYAPDVSKKTDEPKATGYGYVPKPKVDKPKVDGYENKPNVPKPKADKPKTTGYGYTPDVPKPKANKPKFDGYKYLPTIPKPKGDKSMVSGYGYVPNAPKPKTDKPKTTGYEYVPKPNVPKPKIEKPKAGYGYEVPKTIGIQGLIYCKSGSKLVPLEGATARITCFALDKDGYESAPLSVPSCRTDAKGYFLATVTAATELLEGLKIKECKAFLENSPLKDCNVPTDLNKGISGASLYTPRPLHHLDLYSVGPFAYAPPQTKPNVPSGY